MSVVLSQIIGLYFFVGTPDPIELVLYPILAIAGGFLGGLRSWNVLAGQEVLYKASRDVSAARKPSSPPSANSTPFFIFSRSFNRPARPGL
ncbi:MAG: hypothetical protein QOI57_930 [Rubrobacteraceae bacterium]|nr:hypothetical protein [Rubrobacteraceae bacterium]